VKIVPLSAQGLKPAPQQIDTGFRLIAGDGRFALQRNADGTVRLQRVSPGVHDQPLDEVAGSSQLKSDNIEARTSGMQISTG
jgi:hypothetical protein